MISAGFLSLLWLAAGGLFILSLSGLSRQETADGGNRAGMIGMALAVLATLLHPDAGQFGALALALLVAAVVGLRLAARVPMTSMPELVALLHSFVGLAAVFVGLSTYLSPPEPMLGAAGFVHALEVYVDVTVGALTFTGSIVAWAKLEGRLSGKPMRLPARHGLNLGAAIALAVLTLPVALLPGAFTVLVLAAVLAGALGAHLVLAIGGGDMPVVVSLLNAWSGWTAAAAGFMLGNDLLIITGALVGSSGTILSWIMANAMNRSLVHVVFGTFGEAPAAAGPAREPGEVVALDTDGLAGLLADARDVLIVPGYGMAVARAQASVRELTDVLRARGARVRFAIHPVAGRLPGHMNVLLAEAGVPYDLVHEMDEVADDVPEADVTLVIGANDIVNPAAQDDPSSPIYGMPVIEAWKSRRCVVLKRGMATGYAGIDNPLFGCENTRMVFGDARDTVTDTVTALRTRAAEAAA